MNTIIRNFTNYLGNNNIHYDSAMNNDNIIVIKNPLQKNSSVTMRIFVGCNDDTSDTGHIALRGFGDVNELSYNILYKLNELNSNYRWFKFEIDEDDKSITMTRDFKKSEDTNEQIMELIVRGLNLADECYPQIMKCIWA